MAGEIWKDIAGFEGHYQVSNLGRIKSLYFRNRMTTIYKEKILVPQKRDGYLKITLFKNGNITIWRSMAEIERELHYKQPTITYYCQNNKLYKNSRWQYLKEDE